jgi:hypothetical protein
MLLEALEAGTLGGACLPDHRRAGTVTIRGLAHSSGPGSVRSAFVARGNMPTLSGDHRVLGSRGGSSCGVRHGGPVGPSSECQCSCLRLVPPQISHRPPSQRQLAAFQQSCR